MTDTVELYFAGADGIATRTVALALPVSRVDSGELDGRFPRGYSLHNSTDGRMFAVFHSGRTNAAAAVELRDPENV